MSLAEVVRSRDGLQLSLAVTLLMATLVAFLRPYAQAQALSVLAQFGDDCVSSDVFCSCSASAFLKTSEN